MNKFLGLSDQQICQLRIETIHNPGECLFQTDNRVVLRVSHAIKVDSGRDEAKYLACFCHTGRYAAGDATTVYLNNGSAKERVGYVFPANSFAEPSVWDDTWQAYFAEVGFRKLVGVESIKVFSQLTSVPSDKESEKSFDEVFSEETAVLVLSKDATRKLRMSLHELELSLMHAGIYVLRRRLPNGYPEPNRSPEGNYTLRTVSRVAAKDASAFVDLMRRADSDQTGVGAFLIYYQAIEYCIDHILNWSIRSIATSTASAWDIKDELSKVANEKHRISKLEANHLSGTRDRAVFASLSAAARRFIAVVSDEDTSSWGWGHLVYRARNIIVHNQLSLLRADRLDEVGSLNKELRKACLEIFVHFQPG